MKVEIVRNLPQDVETNKIYLVESSLNNNFGDKGKRINSISISDEVGKVGNIPLLQSSATNRLYYSDNSNFFNELAYVDDINGNENLLRGTEQFILSELSSNFLHSDQSSEILRDQYKGCNVRRFKRNFKLAVNVKHISGRYTLSFKAKCPSNGRYRTSQNATLNSGGVIESQWTDCYISFENLNTGSSNPYTTTYIVEFTGASNSNPIDICQVKLEEGSKATIYKMDKGSIYEDLTNVLSKNDGDWVSGLLDNNGSLISTEQKYLCSQYIDIPESARYVSVKGPRDIAYGVVFYDSNNVARFEDTIWVSNGFDGQVVRELKNFHKRLRYYYREIQNLPNTNRRRQLLAKKNNCVVQFTGKFNNTNTNLR